MARHSFSPTTTEWRADAGRPLKWFTPRRPARPPGSHGLAIRVALVLGFGFLGLLLFYKEVIVFSFGPNGSGENASPFTTALVFSRLSAPVLAGGLLGPGDVALPGAVIPRSANLVAALAPR